MTQPPNIREVDCCSKCLNRGIEGDGGFLCYIHEVVVTYIDICDDFKREE